MEIILMRGIPRSGKSTWIRQNKKDGDVICSADHYHYIDENWETGVYVYDPLQAKAAHTKCFRKYMDHLYDFDGRLIVDNTNISVWEISPYMRLAEAFHHHPKILRIHVDFATILKRSNDHNVPESTLWNMYQNLLSERLPSWWKEEIISGDLLL